MPRSAATCAIGRSLSSASRTPRSNNSSGYFLGLDTTAENLLSPGQHPGIEVSVETGPAQTEHRTMEGEVGMKFCVTAGSASGAACLCYRVVISIHNAEFEAGVKQQAGLRAGAAPVRPRFRAN